MSIAPGGCTGAGGNPMVAVTVENAGVVTRWAWLDLFTGLASAPSVGQLSSIFVSTGTMAPQQVKTISVEIDNGFSAGWVDVILDTVQSVDELNESNNVGWRNLTLPDCTAG